MSGPSELPTRMPRACAPCKSKKLRCEPSKEFPSICHRCHRTNKDCILPEAKTRKCKTKVRARLELLEQNYDGILELLSERQRARTSAMPNAPQTASESAANLAGCTAPSSSGASAQFELRASGHLQPPLGLPNAEELMEYYRHTLQEQLPLVLLPEHHHLAYLREKKPCLLLAVLTVSSWKQRIQQLHFEKQLLQDFAARYFTYGEKSLDMLQALIVYVCWIQFASEPLSSHAYRLITSAITLVVDLGLDKPPNGTLDPDGPRRTHLIGDSQSSRFWNREARRAFVGVYILATTCTIALRKDTSMRYSDYVEECALSLAELPETSYDVSWVHYVRLSHIGTEIKDTFGWRLDPTSSTSDNEISMLVKSLEQKMNSWRTSLPATVEEHVTTRIACSIRYAAMYEIGTYGLIEGQPLSSTRVNLLFKCIDSIRHVILTMLSLPLTTLEAWSALDWRHLKYTLMLGSKIALVIDSVARDKESATRIVTLDVALEKLSTRVSDLLVMSNNPPGQTHYYQRLCIEWQQMRRLYQPAKERLANLAQDVGGGANAAEADFAQPSNYLQPEAPALGNNSSIQAMFGDLFGTIDDWSQEDFWLTAENIG